MKYQEFRAGWLSSMKNSLVIRRARRPSRTRSETPQPSFSRKNPEPVMQARAVVAALLIIGGLSRERYDHGCPEVLK